MEPLQAWAGAFPPVGAAAAHRCAHATADCVGGCGPAAACGRAGSGVRAADGVSAAGGRRLVPLPALYQHQPGRCAACARAQLPIAAAAAAARRRLPASSLLPTKLQASLLRASALARPRSSCSCCWTRAAAWPTSPAPAAALPAAWASLPAPATMSAPARPPTSCAAGTAAGERAQQKPERERCLLEQPLPQGKQARPAPQPPCPSLLSVPAAARSARATRRAARSAAVTAWRT